MVKSTALIVKKKLKFDGHKLFRSVPVQTKPSTLASESYIDKEVSKKTIIKDAAKDYVQNNARVIIRIITKSPRFACLYAARAFAPLVICEPLLAVTDVSDDVVRVRERDTEEKAGNEEDPSSENVSKFVVVVLKEV